MTAQKEDPTGTMAVAPDGSPVAFYARLPATGEPELVHALLRPGASVLDLGCGPGRIAGPLAALGHRVTGVDDGPGMVAALPPAVEGVVADARTVRLGRRFDAVLLRESPRECARRWRRVRAPTAAAHVEPDGIVIGETYPPGWDPAMSIGRETRLGDARITLLRATLVDGLIEAEVRYGVDGVEWTQPFSARLLNDAGIRALLIENGLEFDRWLDRPGWFVARRPTLGRRRIGSRSRQPPVT